MLVALLLFTIFAETYAADQCPTYNGTGINSFYNTNSNKCYVTNNNIMSWPQGQSYCQSLGGHLTSIHSDEQTKFLLDSLPAYSAFNPWIGLNAIRTFPNFTWIDGTDVDYNRLKKPFNITDIYVFLDSDGNWRSVPMSNAFNRTIRSTVLCEVPPAAQFQCPSGIVYDATANKCYLFNTTQLSWQDALSSCKQDGGQLVSIHNDDQNSGLADEGMIAKLPAVWIGFNEKLNLNANFTWSDNSPVDYTSWDPRGPSQCMNGPQKCVAFAPSNKYWYNCWECEHALPFICQYSPSK